MDQIIKACKINFNESGRHAQPTIRTCPFNVHQTTYLTAQHRVSISLCVCVVIHHLTWKTNVRSSPKIKSETRLQEQVTGSHSWLAQVPQSFQWGQSSGNSPTAHKMIVANANKKLHFYSCDRVKKIWEHKGPLKVSKVTWAPSSL